MSDKERRPFSDQFRQETSYVRVTFDSPESRGEALRGLFNHSSGRWDNETQDTIMLTSDIALIMRLSQFHECLDNAGDELSILAIQAVDPHEVEKAKMEIESRPPVSD